MADVVRLMSFVVGENWRPMETAPKQFGEKLFLLWGGRKRLAEWNEAWGYQGWFLVEPGAGWFPEGYPEPAGWLPC